MGECIKAYHGDVSVVAGMGSDSFGGNNSGAPAAAGAKIEKTAPNCFKFLFGAATAPKKGRPPKCAAPKFIELLKWRQNPAPK